MKKHGSCAREAEQAPRPAIHEHPVYQSPRYHRRGALHLMAALSVAEGLVYGQCHPRKRFVDFRSFLETAIITEALQRDVQAVALVLDNGSTHARHPAHPLDPGEGFDVGGETEHTALLAACQCAPFSISWRSGSVCSNANSCSLTISAAWMMLPQTIGDFIARYNQTAQPLKWSYTVEQLEHKLATRLRGGAAA